MLAPGRSDSARGQAGLDRLTVRASGQLLDCLVCIWSEEGARTRRGIRVVRGISGAMVEVRDDQPGTARLPGNRSRTVGRTCPGCCCPTSDYPRSDQRRQESHYKPHATPPFRSANRPIRSAAEPDFRMPAGWCQEALDWWLRRGGLGERGAPRHRRGSTAWPISTTTASGPWATSRG